MTARCALYMGALKNFESHWVRPRLLVPKYLMGFCSDRSDECSIKFELRSFTRSWDNSGYTQNLGSSWIRPRKHFSKIFNRLLFGWTPAFISYAFKPIVLLHSVWSLLSRYCRPSVRSSVCLSVTLRVVALRAGVGGWKLYPGKAPV